MGVYHATDPRRCENNDVILNDCYVGIDTKNCGLKILQLHT